MFLGTIATDAAALARASASDTYGQIGPDPKWAEAEMLMSGLVFWRARSSLRPGEGITLGLQPADHVFLDWSA